MFESASAVRKAAAVLTSVAVLLAAPGLGAYDAAAAGMRSGAPSGSASGAGRAASAASAGVPLQLPPLPPGLTGLDANGLPLIGEVSALSHGPAVPPESTLPAAPPVMPAATPPAARLSGPDRGTGPSRGAAGELDAAAGQAEDLGKTLAGLSPDQARERADFTAGRRPKASALDDAALAKADEPARPRLSLARRSALGVKQKLGQAAAGIRASASLARDIATGDPRHAGVLKPHRKLFRVVAALLVADAALNFALSQLVSPLLDAAAEIAGLQAHTPSFIADKIARPVIELLAGQGLDAGAAAIGFYCAAILATFGAYLYVENRHVLLGRLGSMRVIRDYRAALMRKYLRFEMAFHLKKENNAGALGNRLLNDLNLLENRNFTDRVSVPHYLIATTLGVAAMLLAHVPLTLLVLGGVVVLAWTNQRYSGRFNDISFKNSNLGANLMAAAKENFQQVKNIKGAGAIAERTDMFAAKAEEIKALSDEEARLQARFKLGADASEFITKSLVFIVGAVLLKAGTLSYGQITSFMLAASLASYGFNGTFARVLSFRRHTKGSEIVAAHLAREPGIKDLESPAELKAFDGTIVFDDVSFLYPDGNGRIENVSFRVEPGQTVAFVGGKGSGKSTIMRLLSRLWVPDGGSIRLNREGVDLQEIELQSYLSRAAFMPQSTRLFDRTLRYNLTYGSRDVDEERLARAIEAADAKFIYDKNEFPDGLDTQVAEGGARLSGGQLQRIHIVRAILREASLLVLDEPTSALNGVSESSVFKGLAKLRAPDGRAPTRLIIAHRLPTARHADVIHVMDKGRLIESGTHDALIERDGLYAELWRAGGYDQDATAATQLAAAGASFGAAAILALSGKALLATSAVLAVPQFALAAVAGAIGLGFTLVGARIAGAIAKHLKTIEAVGPRGPTARRSKLRAMLRDPIARQSETAGRAAYLSAPASIRRLIDAHEQAHRDGAGEFGALAGQIHRFPRVFRDEARALRIAAARGLKLIRVFFAGDQVVSSFVDKRRLAWLSVRMAGEALLAVAGGSLIGRLLGAAMGGGDVLGLSIGIGALAVFGVFLGYRNGLATALMRNRLLFDLQVALHRKLLDRELSFFRAGENNSTKLSVRNVNDVKALAEKNTIDRLPLIKNLLFFIGSAGMLMYLQPLFALIVIGSVPLQGVVNGIYGRRAEANYEEYAKLRADVGRGAAESLDLLEQIKTAGMEKAEGELSAARVRALSDNGEQGAHLIANAHTFSSSLRDLFTKYMIYLVGSAFVAFKFFGMDLAQIAEAGFFAGFIAVALDSVTSGWMRFSQKHGETREVRGQLGRAAMIKDGPSAYPLPAISGAIAFENVTFSYAKNQSPALDGFSLDIEPGETVAFVADSGAGKSTLFDMLKRYYDPQAGAIKLDGHDLRDLTLESVGKGIAFVPQDTTLFNDTLRGNMLFGTQGVSEERLMNAIRAASADWALERGLDERVEKGGDDLSGGQRQSILFVRALLSDARILLLDEATKAFDKISERHIKKELERRKGGQTILMIAHNLQTITHADRIVVMRDGRVDDIGTHEELLARSDIYLRNWNESLKKDAPDLPVE